MVDKIQPAIFFNYCYKFLEFIGLNTIWTTKPFEITKQKQENMNKFEEFETMLHSIGLRNRAKTLVGLVKNFFKSNFGLVVKKESKKRYEISNIIHSNSLNYIITKESLQNLKSLLENRYQRYYYINKG